MASEVATAIRGAIASAKLSLVPIRLGFWGTKIGAPHTVPVKVHGKCGSVIMRLVPAPRGTGLVAPVAIKKVLTYAGVKDVYTNSSGSTKTLGNFVKATVAALESTCKYLTPDLWTPTHFSASPYQEYSQYLRDIKGGKKAGGH